MSRSRRRAPRAARGSRRPTASLRAPLPTTGGGLHSLVPQLWMPASALISWAERQGWAPRVTSARRTRGQQARLYRTWLAGLSPYPAAPPGQSMHELGRAFDLGGLSDAQLATLGAVWERLTPGARWGGRFHDPIHFEL